MPSDDVIPGFLDLGPQPRRRRRANTEPARPQTGSQLRFDLSDPVVASAPLPPVPELPPLPVAAPSREAILYSVRQLINELRQHIELGYSGILNVEGEISNCRPANSGHLYFTLKDGDAQLPVVLFRRQAQLLGFKLRDGLAVEVRGRISVYETRGQLQLIAESARPRGTGALQLAFEQLRDRLRLEGLFDRQRTPLPPFPHCIGVVTSPSGAALRDVIQVIRRRHARLNLLVYPAVVQGPMCAAQVAAGIRFFNRQAEGHAFCVDLILIARGGGSLEDLAGFNDEALARVIAASRLPVVSAIGHEIDHTIADFVADLRAPTPSAAAELITAAQHRIEERVHGLERRVLRASEFHLLRARQRLQRLSAGHVLARLRDQVSQRHQRIDELHQRLAHALFSQHTRRLRQRTATLAALEERLRRHDPTLRLAIAARRLGASSLALRRLGQSSIGARRSSLERATVRLQALSPLAVLNRGYALVYQEHAAETATLLRSAGEASPGAVIRARLGRGSLRAQITEIQTTETSTQ